MTLDNVFLHIGIVLAGVGFVGVLVAVELWPQVSRKDEDE